MAVTLSGGVQPAYRPNVRLRSTPSLRLLRAAPLLIALLSAVLLGGVQEASCEIHGPGAARADAAMTGHGSAAAGAHHGARGAPDGGDAGCDCSCIGACAMSAPLATPPAAVTLSIARVLPEPSRPIDRAPDHAPAREVNRLLPFANGPPAASV